MITRAGAGTPVNGALVVVIDSAGRVLTSALSDGAGVADLRTLGFGTYRLRVERIGAGDALSDPVTVRTADLTVRRVVVDDRPNVQHLRAVRVRVELIAAANAGPQTAHPLPASPRGGRRHRGQIRLSLDPISGEIVLAGIHQRAGEFRAVRPAGTLGVRYGSVLGSAFDGVSRRPCGGTSDCRRSAV